MGWRGITRSLIATARAAERNEQRLQRALLRQQREAAKHAVAAHAEQVVVEHDAFVRRLVSVHTHGSPARNWHALAQSHPPPQPQYQGYYEQQARQNLEAFKPSVGDRLLGRVDDIRQQLEQALVSARSHDHAAHQHVAMQYQQAFERWQWESDLARSVLSGDLEAHRAALEYLFPVREIPELARLQLSSDATWYVDAVMELHSDDDLLPDEFPTQLKNGTLSWKKLPKGKYNELLQDHICSAALRIAWELIALLPIRIALVHVMMDMLNKATGHIEPMPVLSAAIARDTLMSLNPERIDPSDSMRNFVHNMKFSARSGFSPVDKLVATDFAPPSLQAHS